MGGKLWSATPGLTTAASISLTVAADASTAEATSSTTEAAVSAIMSTAGATASTAAADASMAAPASTMITGVTDSFVRANYREAQCISSSGFPLIYAKRGSFFFSFCQSRQELTGQGGPWQSAVTALCGAPLTAKCLPMRMRMHLIPMLLTGVFKLLHVAMHATPWPAGMKQPHCWRFMETFIVTAAHTCICLCQLCYAVLYHATSRLVLQAQNFAVIVFSVSKICTVKATRSCTMPDVMVRHDVLAFTMILLQ